MQLISHIQILKETIAKLQNENAVLAAGKTAIELVAAFIFFRHELTIGIPNRGAYTALLSHLTPASGSSDDPTAPLSIGVEAPSLKRSLLGLGLTPPPTLERSKYPAVRFWTERDLKLWKKSPEGIAKPTAPVYLEDKNGKQLDDSRITKINSTMSEVWLDLRSEGHIDAQMNWTSMPLTVKKTFRWELANTFVEFTYCEDLWKVDAQAKAIYPSWKQTWFTKKSGNAAPGKRMKVEEDTGEDLDESTGDSAVAGPEGGGGEEFPVDAAATSFTHSSSTSSLSHNISEASATGSSAPGSIPRNIPDHKKDANSTGM